MKLLIKNGRVVDPASGPRTNIADVCDRRGSHRHDRQEFSADFNASRTLDASRAGRRGRLLSTLAARPARKQPGTSTKACFESEMGGGAVGGGAGGVTSLVCPPDHTDPVLDEPRPRADAEVSVRAA